MPSNHLILCCPLLLLPPIPPSRGLPTNKGHKLLLIETLFCALAYSTFRVVLWSRSLTNKDIYYSLVGSTEVGQSWWLFDSAKDSAFFPSLSSATNNISFHPKAGNLICARSQATFQGRKEDIITEGLLLWVRTLSSEILLQSSLHFLVSRVTSPPIPEYQGDELSLDQADSPLELGSASLWYITIRRKQKYLCKSDVLLI